MEMHPKRSCPDDPPATMQLRRPHPDYPYTSVNMAQNPEPAPEHPTDYLAWSLFNLIFFNAFFIGYVATVFSIRSRDSRQMNDPMFAAKYASIAKILNIFAVAITLLLCFIIPLVFF